MKEITCYIDGSCEPVNPGGKMGIGITMEIEGKKIDLSDSYEENPNNSCNLAEYLALQMALIHIALQRLTDYKILFRSDSQLLINQMKGNWKIKKGAYADCARLCKRAIYDIGNKQNIQFDFQWIPREQNEYADNLSKL